MLFTPLFLSSRLADAVSERAWYAAMLRAEAALVRAEARAGIVPNSAAEEIASRCEVERFDLQALGDEARGAGNPAEPLARKLRGVVSTDAAPYVHFGATSQDILDTAAMLIAQHGSALIEGDLRAVAEHCAYLAATHRDTLMVGRTLLQHAVPITFGLKAAEWLAGVTRAGSALYRVQERSLAAELGGAAGTLAALGNEGFSVLRYYAEELGLGEPEAPWHTERTRIGEIASALAVAAGALEKIALDIVLLSQTEVGEVAEGGAGGKGGSSTMPHKRNPVGAVMTRACARQAMDHAAALIRAGTGEYERAAGAWHAEWEPFSAALAYTGGAAEWLAATLDTLEIRPDRMRENLESTGGLIMAERLSLLLAKRWGRDEAHKHMAALAREASPGGRSFRDIVRDDPWIREALSVDEIDSALDPGTYLGSSDAFIDRAIALFEGTFVRGAHEPSDALS